MIDMTKEELWKHIVNDSQGGAKLYQAKPAFDQFFSQNVVIPKGENRHPFAEVLHEWVEGVHIQSKNDRGIFVDEPPIGLFYENIAYRIKPSEPVYEWQWITISQGGKIAPLTGGKYFTQEEFDAEEWQTMYYTFVKIEETKRVRQ